MTEEFTERQKSLTDHVRVLYTGRWIILSCFLVVLGATTYFTYTTVPIYEARAKVMIRDDGNASAGLFEVSSFMKKETMINNQVEILKSRTLAETAIDRLRTLPGFEEIALLKPPSADPRDSSMIAGLGRELLEWVGLAEEPEPSLEDSAQNKNGYDPYVGRLRQSVIVQPIRNTDMIEIRVTATDPKEAATLANTLTLSYAELNRRMSQEEVTQVKNFLDEQLSVIQKQLASSENALKNFKEREKVVALPDETNELIKKLAEFESLYNEALTELNSNKQRLEYINKELGENRKNFNMESVGTAPYLESLSQQIASLETERAAKLTALVNENAYDRDHPQLKRIDEKIEKLKESFRTQMGNLSSVNIFNPVEMTEKLVTRRIEIEANIAALQPQVGSLKKIVDSYAKQLDTLPEKSLKLAKLERSARVDEKIYLMMKEKFQETRITEVGQLGEVRIIDAAMPRGAPIKPRKKLNMALGALFGLGLGIGLTFLLEAMDNSVRTIEDVEKLKINVLGSIPTIKEQEAIKRLKISPTANGKADSAEAKKMAARLITHFAPKSPISEAYRTFRTNMQYARVDKKMKSVLVTSPGPGEGKSTTIANLAITMAQMGSKILLIDADLRRPVQHSIFKMDRRSGLTNVLVGRMELDEAINETEIDNLYVMPCGTLPPNPSELLGSDSMKKVLEQLEERFDLVLFDSPPIIAVTDAAVLSKQLDGIILVIKSGQTDREATFRARSLLANVKTPILGALLNGVNVENMYGSYYYYYHYYYYGKDHKKRSRKKRPRKSKLSRG